MKKLQYISHSLVVSAIFAFDSIIYLRHCLARHHRSRRLTLVTKSIPDCALLPGQQTQNLAGYKDIKVGLPFRRGAATDATPPSALPQAA